MKDKALISIITPCYNGENTIEDTILSVLNQTYSNWEMLIIDDCSTDNSNTIIQHYCKQEPRIKFFKTKMPSGSPALPRNIGLENATGQYICFLDCDDCWLPTKLQDQIEFITKYNYDFIYSNYEKISSNGQRNHRTIKTKVKSNYFDNLKTCEIPCLTTLIRRETIGPIRFTHAPKEDYIFWLAILKKGVIAYNTNQVHGLYRESKASRSSDKKNMIKAQWYVLHHIEGIKSLQAIYYMITYLWYGCKKYIV